MRNMKHAGRYLFYFPALGFRSVRENKWETFFACQTSRAVCSTLAMLFHVLFAPRARLGRESLPRLLEVKLRLRYARLVLQQRECPRRPIFCGSKLGLRMTRVPNTLARLVEVKLWKSHRARAYTRTSIWAVKQAQKIND